MSVKRFVPARVAGVLLFAAGGLMGAGSASAQTEATSTPATAYAPADSAALISFDIPAQDLGAALNEYARQSGRQLFFAPEAVAGKTGTAISGNLSRDAAIAQLLLGTGLDYMLTPDGGMMIGTPDAVQTYRARAQERNGAEAGVPGNAAAAPEFTPETDPGTSTEPTTASVETTKRGGIEEIIVTGQKKAERIQDVPIAITALSMEDLTVGQIAGGADLFMQVPNMTFTKTNFTSYSIQIRGIGTQAVSATTDPAVAVAMNSTPFIHNRFFEQEFFDLERVEILRGPQGTLYGRNATAGVVNLITNKPSFKREFMGLVDAGNYNSFRWEAMANEPLVDDVLALRIAGAGTTRDGYATNELTGNPIDGRDLWSSRVSLRFTPNESFDATLMWEHFEEKDDRIRSGKQLCKQDIAPFPYRRNNQGTGQGDGGSRGGIQALHSQGCERNSLYDEASFEVPMGPTLPYYVPLGGVGLPVPNLGAVLYANQTQSRDLRTIESSVDPDYRAEADVGLLSMRLQVTEGLALQSETAYNYDYVFSMQDFNRFNTAPGAWRQPTAADRPGVLTQGPAGGIFCDPQLGCSDRLIVVDLSTAESEQFSQEFRLSSAFDGPLNFSIGANVLSFRTDNKFYVFSNSFSLFAANGPTTGINREVLLANAAPYVPGVSTNGEYMFSQIPADPNGAYGIQGWIYMDPNPIDRLNEQGHNYFLSKNPYRLLSYSLFGETYWEITDALKLTAGARWSVDEKEAPRIPSGVLLPQSIGAATAEVVEQRWSEPTGRLVLDWKPDLSFTDETLLFASLARGYKAGGANPPGFIRIYYADEAVALGNSERSLLRPKTFDAEFINAFEIGAKNTLLDGNMTLNLAAFYYDYKDYQISEIVDRSAFNRNFDAMIWGMEIETSWWVKENIKLGFKGGYTQTRIADGEKAIDLMDRTAGDPEWMLSRPFPTFASSCILPTHVFVSDAGELWQVGNIGGGGSGPCELAYGEGVDPFTGLDYVPNPTIGRSNGITTMLAMRGDYQGWDPNNAADRAYTNDGDGIAKDLSGNELPNAPNWTATLSGDYVIPLSFDWSMTLHTDLYWQSDSWWRVFDDHEYNRLEGYFTMNVAAIVGSDSGWSLMAYVKNVTNNTALTGAFLNSDDTGLTTNVFLTEPRLYGLRLTKRF